MHKHCILYRTLHTYTRTYKSSVHAERTLEFGGANMDQHIINAQTLRSLIRYILRTLRPNMRTRTSKQNQAVKALTSSSTKSISQQNTHLSMCHLMRSSLMPYTLCYIVGVLVVVWSAAACSLYFLASAHTAQCTLSHKHVHDEEGFKLYTHTQ